MCAQIHYKSRHHHFPFVHLQTRGWTTRLVITMCHNYDGVLGLMVNQAVHVVTLMPS